MPGQGDIVQIFMVILNLVMVVVAILLVMVIGDDYDG